MEFIGLDRYLPVEQPRIPPLAELRRMAPLRVTQDLRMDPDPANLAYARSLAGRGVAAVPIRRLPPDQVDVARLDFPRRLMVEVTSRCDSRCRMCPQPHLKRPKIDMPFELFQKVLDEADRFGVEGVWLYHLGEAILHARFPDIVRYLAGKRNLGVVWLSTIGRQFSEEKARLVLDSRIDFLNFSVHSLTHEVYRTVVTKGDFKAVQANLERFMEMKGSRFERRPFLRVAMVEQENTRHEVDAFLNRYIHSADLVSVNLLEYAYLPGNAFGLERKREPLASCRRVSRQDCFVSSNGIVSPCDVAHEGELGLGNANERPLSVIWNGEAHHRLTVLNNLGRMNENELCNRCTDYDL